MKNKLKTYTVVILGTLILTGCVAHNRSYGLANPSEESYNIPKIKKDCEDKGQGWKVKIFSDGSALCVEDEKTKERLRLKRLAKYEKDYLNEYEQIKNNMSSGKEYYFQPINKKEPCKVFMAYNSQKDESSKLYWDGECKNGYATGIGRLFQKADLTDRWQLGLYKKGKVKEYCILNNILHGYKMEGECKYNNTYDYQVKIYVKNTTTNNISLIYSIGKFAKYEPSTFIQTSPFWNNAMRYLKVYPNFRYEYIDSTKNDEVKLDFGFWIYNKNNIKNGWAIEKYKNHNVVYGEYINNKGNTIDLPHEYISKANSIINEIKSDYNKALNAQAQAQLIKKQYLRKICKNSVKVHFMDNEEYKEVCNSQYEKDLFTKINAKLERISKAKIAKLEHQRDVHQQAEQEQYRQKQLEIERQRLAIQKQQAEDAEYQSIQRNLQNQTNSIRQQTENNRVKFYNVTPTLGGGYNIMGY